MTCKDQIKILNDKTESNTNQYKVDKMQKYQLFRVVT